MRSLNKIILLLGMLAIPALCFAQSANFKAPQKADTLHNPYKVNKAFLKLGAQTFKTNCTSCHGNKGKGNGPAAVALRPRPTNLTKKIVQKSSDGALYWKIYHGKGAMPTWGKSLKSKQIWALVAFIKNKL